MAHIVVSRFVECRSKLPAETSPMSLVTSLSTTTSHSYSHDPTLSSHTTRRVAGSALTKISRHQEPRHPEHQEREEWQVTGGTLRYSQRRGMEARDGGCLGMSLAHSPSFSISRAYSIRRKKANSWIIQASHDTSLTTSPDNQVANETQLRYVSGADDSTPVDDGQRK